MNIETQKRFLIRIGFWAVVVLLMLVGFRYILPVVLPFVLAFLIAAILNRPICFLAGKLNNRRALPAIVLTLVFYLLAAVLFGLLGIRILMFVWQMVRSLPQLYRNTLEPALETLFAGLQVYLDELDPAVVAALSEHVNSAIGSLGSFITNASVRIISFISGIAASVPGMFLNVVITIIATFFLAIDFPKITEFLVRQLSDKGRQALEEVRGYVVGTLLKCIGSYGLILGITFLELSIGLSIMRIPNAVTIALCIAVFDILPVLGTGGIMIPWGIVCLILGNWPLGIGMLVLYVVITVIRNIIEPKIVGYQVGLHPVVTLLSMLVGLQFFGLIGLFGFPITLSLLKNLNDRGVIHIFK